MNPRAIFPIIMFTFAGISFAFGGWQYLQARAVQSAAQERMAYMITTIEKSTIARTAKQSLYASIMSNLPPAPSVFGLDLSGSFASQGDDACTNNGQRSVCSALKSSSADAATLRNVCGSCDPK